MPTTATQSKDASYAVCGSNDEHVERLWWTLRRHRLRAARPSDVNEWAAGPQPRVVIVIICDNHDWRLLARLRNALPHGRHVAALVQPAAEFYIRALELGCAGAVALNEDASFIADTIRAAAAGNVILPAAVVATLISAPARTGRLIDDDDRLWLTLVAQGQGADDIAQIVGCSERTAYRRLRRLYDRLQVAGRRDATEMARRLL